MIKRLVDILVASTGIIILFPVVAITSLLVLAKLGRPVFFRQLRPGLHGNPFLLIKFRTMGSGTHIDGTPLPDGERLSRFGRTLRATSLDELPELWNVLKGDMSLVGPRPLLMEYMDLYSSEQARRHDVRPGITGWAQINGRNLLSWQERFAMDIWYVDNRSLWLDIKIILRTLHKVVVREGISGEDSATMKSFKGNNSDV